MTLTSDIVHINSDLKGKEEAIAAADFFNKRNGFSEKDSLHIMLITEELICLVHDIMKGFIGNLWLESKDTSEGVLCKVLLSAQRPESAEQEEQLLSLATSRRNENSMGMIGKIREAIRLNMKLTADGELPSEYKAADNWYNMGLSDKQLSTNDKVGEILWSLEKYRSKLSEMRSEKSDELDELERSIIARLSDDVKIWLTYDPSEVVIEKLIRN